MIVTGVVCAFRSTHPEVRAADAENRRRYQQWRADVETWASQYPAHHPVQITFGGGADRHIRGLTGETELGEGWRISKGGDWVPDKRTKAGRAIAKALEPLSVSGLKRLPGMPDMAFAMQSPGVYDLQGATWVAWSCPAGEVAKGGWSNVDLDLTMWTEMPLRAFYLAVEAGEAQPEAS